MRFRSIAQHRQRREENQHQAAGGQVHVPRRSRDFSSGRRSAGEPRMRHRPPELCDVEFIFQPGPGPARSLEKSRHLQSRRLRLPKKLDEEVARLHLEKIGVKLTKLSRRTSRLPRRSGRRAVQIGALSVLIASSDVDVPRLREIQLARNSAGFLNSVEFISFTLRS